jgi:hypothetical protein
MPVGKWRIPAVAQQGSSGLKKLIWLYFLLLIFEGALRKWVFPEYSAPLLVIRDPIGMLIIFEAYRTGKWPEKWSILVGILTAGFLALCVMQVAMINNPWVAALYGLRSYLLPFPVAFVIGENLDPEDVRKLAIWTLWLMLPETALEALQYLAPGVSFLNVGAYAGGGQIGYAGLHVRASGTFSFVVGPALFGPLAAVFILYGLVHEWIEPKWLLWAAAFALIVSMPVTGSRGFVYLVVSVIAAAAVAAACGVTEFLKSFKIILPLALVFVLASFLPVFSQSSQSFSERFQEGNQVEGGGSVTRAIANRTVIPFLNRVVDTDYGNKPIGIGMGRGSAAVTTLLLGSAQFIAGENEIDRAMNELGPGPGLAFALFRLGLGLTIVVKAYSRARAGSPLALLFAPLMFTSVFLGILEQPTGQGFMVMFLAFSLAALKMPGAERKYLEQPRMARPAPYSTPAR